MPPCSAYTPEKTGLIVIITVAIDREAMQLEIVGKLTSGDRVSIGVQEWVHAGRENRPLPSHTCCLKLLVEVYDICGRAHPGERTILRSEVEVDSLGSDLSFSGLFPGSQGITESEASGPAAELDRKDHAQVAVSTDLQNLSRILLDS